MKTTFVEKLKRSFYKEAQTTKGRLVIAIQLLTIPALMGWYVLLLKDEFGLKLFYIGIVGILLINFSAIALWGNRDGKFWKFMTLAILFSVLVFLIKTGMR